MANDDARTLPFVRDADPDSDDRWRALRTTLVFDGVPNADLRAALTDGGVEVRAFAVGALIPLGGAIGVVRKGRVALARFDRAVLAAERRAAAFGAPARRPHAGARAEAILAIVGEGELAAPAVGGVVACFAVTPVVMVLLAERRAAEWTRRHPFVGDRLRRGLAATNARLAATDEDRGWVGERARRAAAFGFERTVSFARHAPSPRRWWWRVASLLRGRR